MFPKDPEVTTLMKANATAIEQDHGVLLIRDTSYSPLHTVGLAFLWVQRGVTNASTLVWSPESSGSDKSSLS